MSEVTCPECGQRTELVAIRRSAEEFCTHCDFPLFWADSLVPATVPGQASDDALRRMPGAGGRRQMGSKDCPACGELNPPEETHCLRCRSELDPKPKPKPKAKAVLLPPPTPPEPEPEPESQPSWWWAIGSMLALAVLSIVLAIWQ